MKQAAHELMVAGSIYLGCLASSIPVQAQINSDGTLPSHVSQEGKVLQITGGVQAGSNLFHSFQQFSLPTGYTAFFNNNSNIANIISRVTGGSISTIDGLIKANGNANLILINPSGINFGPNARLNIGGSFLASTASSIIFEDGREFSAISPHNPLLTVSVPVGLQMGQNPGAIHVQGTGHNLTVFEPIFSPITRDNNPRGLSVNPGNTLALVGGNINLEGGVLTAEGGRIELGSVAQGLVTLNSTPPGWTLGYEKVQSFQDLTLRSQSLADTSGLSGGSLQVQARNLSLSGGSLLLIQNQGFQPAGNIWVNATESVEISGTNNNATVRSSLTNETVGSGQGGDVVVTSRRLVVQEGATIVAKTVAPGTGKGGNVNLNVSDSVQVIGASAINPSVTSSIVAATFGAGDSGNNTLSTARLTAMGGGTIATATFGIGKGGNLNINATDAIEIIGIEPILFAPSALLASTFNQGNAGNLTVNTPQLTIRDGGRVDASTFGSGKAGSVTINAPKFVEVKGTALGSINPSLVSSSATVVDKSLQEIFGLPAIPSGASGDVVITTGQLKITDQAQVTVRNDGTGDAGTLRVQADSIFLDNQGSISAVTRGGKGGSINLQVQNSLQMEGFSQISSDNLGSGDSGDLRIETSKLRIRDGAFISATTFAEGKGSNIAIRATDSLEITGTGFEEFQETFQTGVLLGTVQPNDRGTGIFLGTSKTGASGHLTIETSNLSLENGAVIFSPTFTEGIGGDISIRASESVELRGSALQSGTSPGSTGTTGKIEIDTGKLVLRDGAIIINATFGDGAGGNVEIKALESVELRNTPTGALLLTGIYANTTLGSGAGGDIKIDTAKLSIRDGVISSNTGASLPTGIIPLGGTGGNVIINATESMEIAGILADTRFPSGLGTTSFSQSPSGNLTVSTKKLIVSEGADISTAALGGGQGGSLTINASESIELIGITIGDLTVGGLLAASGRANLPELEATGASGDIRVTTKNLVVRDGAIIDVQSLGVGDAGNLEIVADSILLDNQGTLSAVSTSGRGGNIILKTGSLLMRRNSQISATSGGIADGGNINISGFSLGPANFIVLLEGSTIAANAFQGRGGNIQIETRGLFVCPDCQITASSEVGVDGLVTINRLQPNPELQVINVPQQVTESEEVVALACSTTDGENRNEFIITGRGGLPPRPRDPLNTEALVRIESSPSNSGNQPVSAITPANPDNSTLPAPARGWYINPDGVVILTAQASSPLPYGSGLTTPKCHGN